MSHDSFSLRLILSQQWTSLKNWSLSGTVGWSVGKEQDSYTSKPDFRKQKQIDDKLIYKSRKKNDFKD